MRFDLRSNVLDPIYCFPKPNSIMLGEMGGVMDDDFNSFSNFT